MSAASPAQQAGVPLTFTISADGTAVDTDQIVSIDIWQEANRIPRARIVLFDGEPDSGAFPFSDADTFAPGAKLVISAGYGASTAAIHHGTVVRHAVRALPGTASQLVIDTADSLLAMTRARHSAVTENGTDNALIAALVSASGGSMGKNDAATDTIESIVQAYASDWDLMLLRAEANGCLVLVDNGTVDVAKPDTSGSPVLALAYGESIVSIDAVIDASESLDASGVKGRTWSYADQKVVEQTASDPGISLPGNLSSSTLADVLSVSDFTQQTAATSAQAGLASWATSALMRAQLSQFTGTVEFQGSALAKPGTTVTLDGLGARFNGNAFVSGVRHRIRDNDWRTTAELGMTAERFASLDPNIADPSAAGLAPPLRGLQTGLVKQIDQDPSGDFRVLVTLPLTDDANGVWARLAQPYASKGFGWSFFPEVGDEVLLGFMNDDPSAAVILASVYSSARAPKYTPDSANGVKSLVTQSKIEFNFNDKDVILKISTPGGRYVTLDDKSGTVTVADPNGNKLVMAADKVDLISAENLNIKSAANMNIECGANLKIDATAKCDVTALAITATGTTNLALASNAMGSLKAAAVLEINGALVKIN